MPSDDARHHSCEQSTRWEQEDDGLRGTGAALSKEDKLQVAQEAEAIVAAVGIALIDGVDPAPAEQG